MNSGTATLLYPVPVLSIAAELQKKHSNILKDAMCNMQHKLNLSFIYKLLKTVKECHIFSTG